MASNQEIDYDAKEAKLIKFGMKWFEKHPLGCRNTIVMPDLGLLPRPGHNSNHMVEQLKVLNELKLLKIKIRFP
ncbi:hypothetical protein SAMN05192574_102255 [Mucilaginibacter gossypiicola]|uniref:Uncharacterized protein n=1 Tax=Mucilaginibacter gossypiicola TaxID=551995 RepID=A0A1H8D8K7_9SPHI|nr:hypothetical protein SAMN05192574_102255 [Mucilaginibacter gossypiicola]